MDKAEPDQWKEIETEVELRARARDMERIRALTGISHCEQCGQPINPDTTRCQTCGFVKG